MAILKVAQMGNPILRCVSRPVPKEMFSDPDFQRFCDDLLETMEDYEGTGLAAPQVHTLLRVVVLQLDDAEGAEPEFLINPVITVLGENESSMMEGCLSVEGMRARVWRPNHIKVVFQDRTGKLLGYELEGFPAVVVQHECDHLDGVLYVDRCETRTLSFMREYKRFGPVDIFLDGPLEGDELDDQDVEEV